MGNSEICVQERSRYKLHVVGVERPQPKPQMSSAESSLQIHSNSTISEHIYKIPRKGHQISQCFFQDKYKQLSRLWYCM